MSVYTIDYSDPLRAGFTIAAGGFNGPGGSSSNTPLRLYGRGALEWGEAVDEDLVRLTENFASASPPSSAISGQIWVERSLYYHDTGASATTGWYYYDMNEVAANKWKLIGGSGILPDHTAIPGAPVEGQYYTNTVTGKLYGYYSLGRYEPITWVERAWFSGVGAPVSPATIPLQSLKVFDEAAAGGSWAAPSTVTASNDAPGAPQVGQLWYEIDTGLLKVWSGAAWQVIIGPTGASLSSASGNIDMLTTHKIINLADGTNPGDAVNKSQLDAAIAGGGAGVFLPLTGGTLSGPGNLTVSGTLGAGATTVSTITATSGIINTTLGVTGLLTAGNYTTSGYVSAGTLATSTSATIGTTLSVGGQLNMNNQKIINVSNGTNAQDAVTKSQMEAAIAGAGVGASVPVIWSSGTYKAGDIAISGSNVYIAVGGGTGGPPGGNWRQVYPAVYG